MFNLLAGVLPSRRSEAHRGLPEARPRTQNVLARGQSEAHGDSNLYNTKPRSNENIRVYQHQASFQAGFEAGLEAGLQGFEDWL